MTSFGVEVKRMRETDNGDTEVSITGDADKIKSTLKWALRGSGESVKDYFEEFAKRKDNECLSVLFTRGNS